jgi:predicted TIM-barrel fold metal-dependent hydrolase
MALGRMPVHAVKPVSGAVEEIAREERRRAAGMLAGATDAHTHLWPEGFYRAICEWFDEHAWKITFRGDAEAAIETLRKAGASTNVALVYAHKPGIARLLNGFLAEVCRAEKSVVGVGTVFPGEPDALDVVREAIDVHGLRGIKLHCHVMGVAIDDPRSLEVLAECEKMGVPAVVHAGREPRAEGYPADPYEICGAAHVENALRALPKLRRVIPHLGLDEVSEHFELLEKYENLYLDTAMACSEYFPLVPDWTRISRWSHRIMLGTDFPITPWGEPQRELRVLARRIEDDAAFERLIRGTARALWQP